MDEREQFEYQEQMDKYSPERLFAILCLISMSIGIIGGLLDRFF